MKSIRIHDTGSAVEDVQKRLRILGYELTPDGEFGEKTRAAVSAFRQAEGLPQGAEVDEDTWHALVDATFALGDRMLYLRVPHFHGHDVRELQNILAVLGFVLGETDGIFGAHTERALREFQSSVGLNGDGIAGTTTFDAISRLRHAWEGKSAAAAAAPEYVGFARAAEALRRVELCFFGLDAWGRAVASRIANLAHATSADAKVTSADSLEGIPPQTMLMVGIAAPVRSADEHIPVVAYSEDHSFAQRLKTAIDAASTKPARLAVDISAPVGRVAPGSVDNEAAEQHIAVIMLDAFCAAL